MYVKEIFLKTSDNTKIAVNFYRKKSDAVLILAPGWFMTKDSFAFKQMAEIFAEYYSVIVLDFRGHGKSEGFYTFSAKETDDLKTVVNFAKKHFKRIFLAGFSLGSAVSCVHTALEKDIDKLILISAPHSFIKIENEMWKKEAWLPTFKKFELKRWISVRPSVIPHPKTKPADVVDKIEIPTLFIAGRKDPTVHAWQTKILFKKTKCIKKFELFENGLHAEDLFLDEPDRFMKLCLDWLTD